jgi:hypothetical protein
LTDPPEFKPGRVRAKLPPEFDGAAIRGVAGLARTVFGERVRF